jgi:hypothetical protein
LADSGNPAWDFQFLIPDYEVIMRAMYMPDKSPEQIIEATRLQRTALGQ